MSHQYSPTELRRVILEMAFNGKEGHVPSALSIVEIVWTLFRRQFVTRDGRDTFILSKGHGCLALYGVLALEGYFPRDWLTEFGTEESRLGGHPDSQRVPGVEASTGSLGHGLAFATGIAFAKKIQGEATRTFVLVGDGECNEGSIWEAAMTATARSLTDLVCLVDENSSAERATGPGNLQEKFRAFGWHAITVNGHDLYELDEALRLSVNAPLAIIAQTVKGKGVSFMEDAPAWHHSRLEAKDFEQAMGELF